MVVQTFHTMYQIIKYLTLQIAPGLEQNQIETKLGPKRFENRAKYYKSMYKLGVTQICNRKIANLNALLKQKIR